MNSRRGLFCFTFFAFFYALNCTASLFPSEGAGAYQTPPVIYTGDKGSLVYQLDAFTPLPEGELIFPDGLPKTNDIIIDKIILDRRSRRVIIDFQVFKVGVVPLPPIPFGETELNGLQVNVASILDSDKASMTLSPSAGLLTAPGTFWMIVVFSTMLALTLIVIVLIFAKGGAVFTGARNSLRTFILLNWINFRLRRLEKRLKNGHITEKDALAALSNEIRAFLSRFWMQPCYALSAKEFLYLTIPHDNGAFCAADDGQLLSALCAFFKKCDETRFSAAFISRETASALFAEAESLINGQLP
ncbi:MAG: hypothetical protein LBC27_05410 [Spirochaetaceae bacterium]|jgi:hypothetical protein|nr:hypothetical protein [Spirochaetaceae bacterium]